jgi:hypothetical protein
MIQDTEAPSANGDVIPALLSPKDAMGGTLMGKQKREIDDKPPEPDLHPIDTVAGLGSWQTPKKINGMQMEHWNALPIHRDAYS